MNTANTKEYVLIVGASDLVMPAFRIAREELGLGVIALDYNPQAPGMLYADMAIPVSTKDVDAAVMAAREVSQEHNIKGVFTCGADVEITVAAIAEALSLPGIPVSVARRCNDKLLMHYYLDSQGFREKAKYQIVNNLAEVEEAVTKIGFPCVFKPIDNCASRGIQRIEGPEAVKDAYNMAVSFNGSHNGEILIEECLEGTKHTVEMLTWQNQWYLLSIIDTHYISPRWPCETGLNTTKQPPEMQVRMFRFAEQVARLIEITYNAHKVDVNVTLGGTIQLIELTARLSGGFHCQYASPLAFGSHDIRAALKLAIGQPLDLEDIRHQYEKGAAVRAVFPKPGRIISISGLEEAKTSPGVAQVFIWKNVGDVIGPYQNSADRPAFVIAKGETTEEAIAKAERGASLIQIRTEPEERWVMRANCNPYSVVVQASPNEILQAPDAGSLNLQALINWPSIQGILVMMPELEGAREAEKKLQSWGIRSFIGDTYNVCFRILAAQEHLPQQEFSVRVLAIWRHIDLEYVDCLVSHVRNYPCDLVIAPKDFDLTLAADVASLKALKRIGSLPGNSQEIVRAKFNPWGYMEMHPKKFQLKYLEPAPRYTEKRCKAILSEQRCHPENEFFGRDYAGSRYHLIAEMIPAGLRILDIACGSGFGSALLSKNAAFVLGVDYLETYIRTAQERYPETDRLRFIVGDGENFLYQNREEQFDMVISLHTLEHVPNDKAMMATLYRNLRRGGQLIVEVPLQAQRPLGVPINPYHLREYTQEQLIRLVEESGFQIIKQIGSCRSFYGKPEQARDAFQIHAIKPL